MSDYSPYRLDFPEAHALGDLEGIKQDLEWVIQAAHFYKEEHNKRNYEFCLFEALCIALVVKYARGHMTGERRRIPIQWLADFSDEEKSNHQYFMDYRNKFVAHSVNGFEENFAVAYFKDVQLGNPTFSQVHGRHGRIVSLSIAETHDLSRLAAKLLIKVNAQIEIEKKIVTDIVRAMPIDQILKQEPIALAMNKEHAGLTRKRKKEK